MSRMVAADLSAVASAKAEKRREKAEAL